MDERRSAPRKPLKISVNVTRSQKEKIFAAARRREKSLSEFLRDAGLEVADRDTAPKRGRPRKAK